MVWSIVWWTVGITVVAIVGIMIFMVVDAFSTKEKQDRYGVEK